MTREELISQCRYYHGEKKNPYEDKNDKYDSSLCWFYEYKWVQMCLNDDREILGDCYLLLAKGDLLLFSQYDGVPATLKGLLFDRYYKWACDGSPAAVAGEDFKKWYNRCYLRKDK